MTKQAPPSRRGRPTAEEAELRHQQLLDVAIESFIKNGFTATSITDIAQKMGMTKRTVYSLYESKEQLFKAAVLRDMQSMSIPEESYRELESESLRDTLIAVSLNRIEMYMGGRGQNIQKLLDSESARFPELVALNYRQNPVPVRNYIASLLKRHKKLGHIKLQTPETTAEMYLHMSVGSTVACLSRGTLKNNNASINRHVRWIVDVFLDGISKK